MESTDASPGAFSDSVVIFFGELSPSFLSAITDGDGDGVVVDVSDLISPSVVSGVTSDGAVLELVSLAGVVTVVPSSIVGTAVVVSLTAGSSFVPFELSPSFETGLGLDGIAVVVETDEGVVVSAGELLVSDEAVGVGESETPPFRDGVESATSAVEGVVLCSDRVVSRAVVVVLSNLLLLPSSTLGFAVLVSAKGVEDSISGFSVVETLVPSVDKEGVLELADLGDDVVSVASVGDSDGAVLPPVTVGGFSVVESVCPSVKDEGGVLEFSDLGEVDDTVASVDVCDGVVLSPAVVGSGVVKELEVLADSDAVEISSVLSVLPAITTGLVVLSEITRVDSVVGTSVVEFC